MKNYNLFTPTLLGNITLKNRIVIPVTSSNLAIDNVPNELMSGYYTQHAGTGLIISEGTSPSPNGLGNNHIPGCYSIQQVVGWKKITTAVHNENGKIFLQLMHVGRLNHTLNLPKGGHVIAPSAVGASGQIWTDLENLQDFTIPKPMDDDDILLTLTEFAASAKHAIDAGFDGVELNGGNGYLLEQFLSPISNTRTDKYGGNIENRCRFFLEVVSVVINSIGAAKTGVTISPFGVANDMPLYPEIAETYTYLAEELNKLGIVYLHLDDESNLNTSDIPIEFLKTIRASFKNTLIISGSPNIEKAEADILSGKTDLVSYNRQIINHPDFTEQLKID
jgi:N-ethylmaleimide reductase